MSDEAFHEIQLNGKQLVFLFMAATVVSVVIFLCGVMVGRGARAERGPEAVVDAATPAAAQASGIEAPPPATAQASPAAGRPNAAAAPAPAVEPPAPVDEGDVDHPATGSAKTLPATPAPAPRTTHDTTAPSAKPADKPPADKPAEAKHDASLMPSEQSGWAVQVGALRDRGEADAMARQLVAKGYQAYVLAPGGTGSPVFKVQIGRFKSRQDAEKTAARVKKDGPYKPWITR